LQDENSKKSRKTITASDKIAIQTLKAAGMSNREVAAYLNINKSSVDRWSRRLTEELTMEVKKRSGRPRKTTRRTDRMILRKIKENRFSTLKHMQREIRPVELSVMTISRRIEEDGTFASYWFLT
jgi:transposase